jgi:hypothetical protein
VVAVVGVVGVVVGPVAVAVGTVNEGAPEVSAEVEPPPPQAATAAVTAIEAQTQMSLSARRGRTRIVALGVKSRAGPSACRSEGSR